MYRLMVAFEPMKATPVDRGRNKGLNLGNMFSESKGTGYSNKSRWLSHGEKTGVLSLCWGAPEKNCPKRIEEKEKKKMTTAASTIDALTGKQRLREDRSTPCPCHWWMSNQG